MRNAPCPCGSGKRYKQCHGLIARGDFGGDVVRSRASEGLEAAPSGSTTPSAPTSPRSPWIPGTGDRNLAVIRMQRSDYATAPVFERGAVAPDEPEFTRTSVRYAASTVSATRSKRTAADSRSTLRARGVANLGLALADSADDEAIEAFVARRDRSGSRASALAPATTRLSWRRGGLDGADAGSTCSSPAPRPASKVCRAGMAATAPA
jgi:hypothetical protein